MSSAGFEIDNEALVRFVVGVVVAQTSGAWVAPGVDTRFHLVREVKR
jgi:hypothetical protein